ncbi:hypothetical protein [Corynebacterium tapiri]|uniref:Uncharacterized protein n=1 Tax=Corynebacterium tapiri TaxID=1448266 RepID=A0A5C4U500_9CORY|nr:hypothetical protein [Corynebacterium tapiri]TNL99236.1 hypothetical protein FHE74_02455 [Corynebacterium tapiri]
MSNPAQLAAEEKQAARQIDLGSKFYWLAAAVVCWVLFLVLPQSGSVRGLDVTLFSASAREHGTYIVECVYGVLIALGLGVFTTLTLITRRTAFALIAWMLTTVGLAAALFSLWLRQTGEGEATGIGMYISIVGVALAVFAYSTVALRRSDAQRTIAEKRAASSGLDEVGQAQMEARIPMENPVLIDDRRQRLRKKKG